MKTGTATITFIDAPAASQAPADPYAEDPAVFAEIQQMKADYRARRGPFANMGKLDLSFIIVRDQ